MLTVFAIFYILLYFSRDNLIGAPRESRLKGASRDSKARVATQRRESRLKGASRDSKARVATQRRESRLKGATQEKI